MSAYHFLGNIRLTIILLLLLVADLCIGYLCLYENVSLFQPMNEVGLKRWLTTYGLSQPLLSGWFFLLLPLLFFLVINTLICTGDKLYHLFTSTLRQFSSNRLWLTLSIHLMHLAMVLLLVGYLTSYTLGTTYPGITVTPGTPATVPNSRVKIELLKMQMVPYSSKRLDSFIGRNIDAQAHLVLSNGNPKKSEILSMNKPVHFQGLSFFLQQFNPKQIGGGMNSAQYIVVDIRRDPGVIPTFTGMASFITGLFGYFFFRYRVRKNRSIKK